MNEENFYSEENEAVFEESQRVSLDKPQQGVYEEGSSPNRGEYRGATENRTDTYQQTGYYTNGYQQTNQNVYGQESQGLGIASLVLGILSLVLFCSCINSPLGIVAIVLGIIQMSRPGAKKGMAIAGIVTSIVSMVLFAISLIAFVSSVDFSDGFRRNLENRLGEDYYEEYNFPDYHIDDHDTF